MNGENVIQCIYTILISKVIDPRKNEIAKNEASRSNWLSLSIRFTTKEGPALRFFLGMDVIQWREK